MVDGDPIKTRELWVADKFSFVPTVTPTAATGSFNVTNWNSDVAMNCDTAADAELADVLGSLIKLLIEKGIVTGTVAA